jgi:hypothetical protein
MSLTLPDLLILALASTYWAFVIPKKAGPYQLFERIRARTTLGGLLLCPPCLVLWVSVVMWLLLQTDARPFVWVSAIAGGGAWLGYYGGMWHQ